MVMHCYLYFSWNPKISQTTFSFMVPYPGFMPIYHLLLYLYFSRNPEISPINFHKYIFCFMMPVFHPLLFIFFMESWNITNNFFHLWSLPRFYANRSSIIIYIFQGTQQDLLDEHARQCTEGLVVYLYFSWNPEISPTHFFYFTVPTPVLSLCIIYCCLYFSFKPKISN